MTPGRQTYRDAEGRDRVYRLSLSALAGAFKELAGAAPGTTASSFARITMPSSALRMWYRFSMRAPKGGRQVFMENLSAANVFTPRPETWEPMGDQFTQGPPMSAFSDRVPIASEVATPLNTINGYNSPMDSDAVRIAYTLDAALPLIANPDADLWLIATWELKEPNAVPFEMAETIFARCAVQAKPIVVSPQIEIPE
jgi:hypothetical protein